MNLVSRHEGGRRVSTQEQVELRAREDAHVGALYNAAVDLLGRNGTADRAGRPYLITDERAWSYGEMLEAADAAGSGLLELGLQRGDRVILATRDRPEFVATFWGAMKAGLVPVPIAQGLSGSDVHFILADSDARVAICDASTTRSVVAAAEDAGVVCLVAGEGSSSGAKSWSDVCGAPARLEPAATTRDDIALWLYTSGTTGLPKAVMHRHRSLAAAVDGLFRQVISMTPEDTVMSVSKMFFAYGLGNSVYLPAAYGGSVIVNDGPAVPASVYEILDRKRPTVLFGVPSFFAGLCGLGDVKLPSSVRMVLSAGEALSTQLFERFKDRFGLPLLDGLGATEALHHFTANRPDDVVAGSAGPALDGYEVQVRDRDEEPVPDGTSGELWVRGPTTFAAYWRRPDLTARAHRGPWMRTGDLVHIKEGRVWHEGRLDDLIKLGGVWVAPVEIEDVLRGHPDVGEVAVVATDEGRGVPLLKAFVTSGRDDSGLRRELLDMCRGRLATFKVPKKFEVVPELPRTQTGKLKRFVLRQSEQNGGDPA
jgi:benzoate-CoA ligase family protein